MGASDWARLSRIEHAVMVVVAVVAAQAVAARHAGIAFDPLSWPALLPALGPFLITAASFVINDWHGLATDRANKRTERPLVSGKIRPADALRASLFLYAFGLLLSLYAGPAAFAVALVYSALSLAYDPVLKKMPLAGNAFIASSMAVSFAYGNLVVTAAFQWPVLLFCAVSFLAGLGRELLITLRDIKGDRKIGATTLPMILGPKPTVALSTSLFAVAAALSWIPAFYGAHPAYAVLVAANNALLLYSVLAVSRSQSQAALKLARNATLAALLLGIVAFCALAL